MKLEQTTGAAITQLWTTVEPRLQLATYLEEAAQVLATLLTCQKRAWIASRGLGLRPGWWTPRIVLESAGTCVRWRPPCTAS